MSEIDLDEYSKMFPDRGDQEARERYATAISEALNVRLAYQLQGKLPVQSFECLMDMVTILERAFK